MAFADTRDKNSFTQTAGIVASGGTPSLTAGAGLGTGSGALSSASRDFAGIITLSPTGSPSASSVVVTVNFSFTLDNAPSMVQIEAANSTAAALSGNAACYVDAASLSTTGFQISVGSTNLSAGQTYKFAYFVTGGAQ